MPDKNKDKEKQQSLPLVWSLNDEPDSDQEQAPPGCRNEDEEPALKPAEDTDDLKPTDDAESGDSPPEAPSDGDAERDAENDEDKSAEKPQVPQPEKPGPAESSVTCLTLDDTEMNVSEMLMEARSACHLTVAQVAQRTKIPPEFIRSIETGRFNHLPHWVYTKAHVNKLCREYKLDSVHILNLLRAECGQAGADLNQQQGMKLTAEESEAASRLQYEPWANSTGINGKSRPFNLPMVLVGLVLTALLVLVLSAIGIQQFRNRHEQNPDRKSSAAGTAAESTSDVVDLEKFIIPQMLPYKELPMPESDFTSGADDFEE